MEPLLERTVVAIAASVLLTMVVVLAPILETAIRGGRQRYLPLAFNLRSLRAMKSLATSNPGISWKTSKVKVDERIEMVPYPWWYAGDLLHNWDLLNDIGPLFLKQFGAILSNTKVCAVSGPALLFLGRFEESLRERGATIFPCDERFHIPDEWRGSSLVLFDLHFNTGNTMAKAAKFFQGIDWLPVHALVVLYNDLVPVPDRVYSGLDPEQTLYLYRASIVVQSWANKDAVEAQILIHEAITGKRPWKEQGVQNALERMRRHVKAVETQKLSAVP